jgi:hypothetical protein
VIDPVPHGTQLTVTDGGLMWTPTAHTLNKQAEGPAWRLGQSNKLPYRVSGQAMLRGLRLECT